VLGFCGRENFEATAHISLELVAGDHLRRLKDNGCVAITQSDRIEERVALFRIPDRSGIAELVLIEPRGSKAKASALAHAG
jgi:hypothetical protein